MFASAVDVQLLNVAGVQPDKGYEQAIAPGVVELTSNNVPFTGAMILQLPSLIDTSSGGMAGFLSAAL